MTDAPTFTFARRRALQTVALHNGKARISNSTNPGTGLVYWQSWNWMRRAGLATSDRAGHISLTPKGWKEAELRQLELEGIGQ